MARVPSSNKKDCLEGCFCEVWFRKGWDGGKEGSVRRDGEEVRG